MNDEQSVQNLARIIDTALLMFHTKEALGPDEHRSLVAEHVARSVLGSGYEATK